MFSDSKSRLNNTARRDMLEKYFENISENNLLLILQNLEKMDREGVIFKQFVLEMVTYIFRNLDDIVSIKEKEEGTIDDVS
jgi:hypothetical protein